MKLFYLVKLTNNTGSIYSGIPAITESFFDEKLNLLESCLRDFLEYLQSYSKRLITFYHNEHMNLQSEMRRSDKAILDPHYVESILKKAPVGILCMCKDETPYSVPVNFYYENDHIYIHCAKEGQKVLYIKANPRVCFLVVHPVDVEETECEGAQNYESILCSGVATFFETSSHDVLTKLGKKYGTCSEITEKELQKTATIQMKVENVSAKRGY